MIAHVFVDAENISPTVTFKVVEHFGKEHTITKVDIIAKEDTLPYKYRDLDSRIYRIQNCFYGKNSADTWLCVEIVRAIIYEPDLELVIIVSSDKDFLPAIKFATDFEKKVLIVSNGVGHKTLIEQLKILGINSSAVELKDFRLKFGGIPLKLEKFLPHFGFELKKFFFDREEKINFILVKNGNLIFEVPFVAGMNIAIFSRVLRELNILRRGSSIRDFIAENFLKIRRDKIYFCTEAEISEPTVTEIVENYFAENTDKARRVFVRQNDKLFEIPFVNGMPLDIFGKLLHEKKIIGKGASPVYTATRSLMKIVDEKVYLCSEDEQELAYDDTIRDVNEYLRFHATEIKKIFIRHNGKAFEIPFVEGMPLELFGKLLREKNITGKSTSTTSIAKKNFMDVRDGKIFICDEEKLREPYTEFSEILDEYFSQNKDGTIKIFVKHNDGLFEIPFVNGMPLDIFGKLLREKKIIGKGASLAQIALKSLMKIVDEKVYLCSEEEQESVYGDIIKDVDEYFRFHAAEIKKIFIKHNGKMFEVPFVDGINLELFGKLLREKNIIGKSTSATSIAKKNFLDVRDGKIFLCDEERLCELYAESTGNLDDYFSQNEDKTLKIFIKHNGDLFEIPFIDGMPLTLFEKLLHEKKIIGKNSSAVRVAAQSLLDVRNDRIFLYGEKALENAENDLLDNVDEYLNEHVLEIFNVDIKHDEKIFSIPFVNGMPLKTFGKLLRERKIINMETFTEEIVASNSFELVDDKIYRRREEIFK